MAARDITRRGIADLRGALLTTLATVVAPGSDIALVGHPFTQNVGDNAIFLGELAYLREAGHNVTYIGGSEYYSRAELYRRLPPGGTVLLHGGGNFGDLYSHHHDQRLRVIDDSHRYRVVQLPQTINFRDRQSAVATAETLRRHPDLILLVRDNASVTLARDLLATEPILCPDIAFALGSQPRPRVSMQTQWLRRADKESADSRSEDLPQGVDWEEVAEMSLARRIQRRELFLMGALSQRDTRLATRLHDRLAIVGETIARDRFDVGIRLIGAGSVLITDRLHAHLLATLCGVPNVVVSDRFGKVRGAYQTWTEPLPIVRLADSLMDAGQRVAGLSTEFGLT